jgi:hypothetical protein
MYESSRARAGVLKLCVYSINVAAWLRLNGEEPVSREYIDEGHPRYLFERTTSAACLLEIWSRRNGTSCRLDEYASIVSEEVAIALSQHRMQGASFECASSRASVGRSRLF